MGKTIEKVKLWNILEQKKIEERKILPIEVEAQIDNGATAAVVLPKKIADELKLPVIRQVWGNPSVFVRK